MGLMKTARTLRTRSRWGFTLTEMMVVIMVMGLMATLTAPPLFRYIQSHRLQTGTDRMMADLQYARSLSVARGDILRAGTVESQGQLDVRLLGLARHVRFTVPHGSSP